MGLILSKFGGCCIGDVAELAKIKNIIRGDIAIPGTAGTTTPAIPGTAGTSAPERRYIVVSAPGKRSEEDQKITDLLYLCFSNIEHNVPYQQVFQVVCERFLAIAAGLGIRIDLAGEFLAIQKKMEHGGTEDYIASRGEYIMAKILAAYLDMDFVDAEGLILFDKFGRLMEEETDRAIREELEKHETAIIPGFYGTLPDGSIKTFVRGGSDITGALVAKAMHADVYENWGDRSGFLMADPAIVENPRQIEHMTYAELRELSYIGSPMMPEASIFPVRRAGIPLHIRSTEDLSNPGTLITTEPYDIRWKESELTGVAGSANFAVFSVFRGLLGGEKGVLRKILSVFEDWDISVEHVPSGIDSLSVIVSADAVEGKEDEIVDELRRKIRPENVVVERVALMNVVGSAFYHRPGCAAKTMTALAKEGISLRMIDQGASEINIILGVAPEEFETAVRAIYKAFEG